MGWKEGAVSCSGLTFLDLHHQSSHNVALISLLWQGCQGNVQPVVSSGTSPLKSIWWARSTFWASESSALTAVDGTISRCILPLLLQKESVFTVDAPSTSAVGYTIEQPTSSLSGKVTQVYTAVVPTTKLCLCWALFDSAEQVL